MSDHKPHPCLTCGACCAFFRVSFSEGEIHGEYKVPIKETVDLGGGLRAMKGTEKKHGPACQCLEGRIGKAVSCRIYVNRSSPCRNFQASFEDGHHNLRCDEARARHGLRPLTKKDYEAQ